MPQWVLMWALAILFYGMGKWGTLAAGLRGESAGRQLAYLFLFPGMDAGVFRRAGRGTALPLARYLRNAACGALLLWGVARLIPGEWVWLRGWTGMVGLILLLHFGLLQLIVAAWRFAGFDAVPLMREPILAVSVGEFWSVRWNTAFHALSKQFVFMPLARQLGARAALAGTFLISGLVHDLVISVPAGGGYGLPTAYFVVQGAGVWFERTGAGRRILRTRWAGRLFAIAVVALPAPMLFHPMFVRNVFVPFMAAIGTLPREGL
jgi:alginate O-acetyltransferase complex protein AlgI